MVFSLALIVIAVLGLYGNKRNRDAVHFFFFFLKKRGEKKYVAAQLYSGVASCTFSKAPFSLLTS